MIEIDKSVTISDKYNLTFKANLIAKGDEGLVSLDLLSTQININDITGRDFFDCLLKLRGVLEKDNLYILCQGSVVNVYPSRMARDMSVGLKAYSLEVGKKASMAQLVDIFDPAPEESVGTIVQQLAFFEQWINTSK